MLYSTQEGVGYRRVPAERAEFLGSARAVVADAAAEARASGSATYAGRSQEQVASAAVHPQRDNPPRAPPTVPCPDWSTGRETMLGRWVRSAQPSATTTSQQMIVMQRC
jgi:hypothetical protein